MAARKSVVEWLDHTLQVSSFTDYAPNGLQVEGRDTVNTVVTSVTASLAAIEYAADKKADLLLVHHGLFWRSEPVAVVGWKKQRIEALLRHQINMAGYHLPLDAHPELGNNAQLAKRMGWIAEKRTGEQNLLNIGCLSETQTLAEMAAMLEKQLMRKPVVVGDGRKAINRVAWCTGGAQGFFQNAVDQGADVYVTGEISEAQYHLANETGVAFVSAGHHATERYGVAALGQALQKEFGLVLYAFDEPNPA
ncbi:MAG: Nif3-like dinuclear metal center hexameric protein [Neisseria sp.]|uniref:Nif3-like dinuclear metal center hexameric protein n=1 Tax=Neisseria sp. TaxID=192066 RepID=UPI0026DBE1D8|nr:Nif3-like dinuclear metal center hexameric protein [Neisseria sp.]MDO4249487.1 Nif3-like dinuclear metal center hexameric protein [Neisseria sp.]